MLNSRVSIIINNFNYSQFLAQAIDSALNQTYCDVEVVVVDDGSKDNSPEIIKSYGDAIVPVLKENGGQASAINAGFMASQGEIVMLLDADDYLHPFAVEQVVSAWKSDTVQVQSRLQLVDPYGKHIDIYPKPEIPFDSGEVSHLLLERGRYRTTVTSGLSFSRKALAQILPIPEAEFRISADGYLVTLVPFYGKVVSIDRPLGVRRYHGSNLWSSTNKGKETEQLCKSINHDLVKYKFLAKKATELGKGKLAEFAFNDYIHLTNRIASLRLDPNNHPLCGDSRLVLAYMGYRAIWQYSKFSRMRKLVLSSWFLWVGLLPQPLAKPAIDWLIFRKSRPDAIDRLVKIIRRATNGKIVRYENS